jgi:hypothetical protein
MKERAILLSTLALLVTVAVFAWWTRARWGVIGIYPALGWLVLGAAFFAVAVVTLFLLARPRTARVRRPPAPAAPPAFQTAPVEPPSEAEPEEAKVTVVEIK